MADTNGGDDRQDKPRRLEDETADYLAKIELQFTDALDAEDKVNLVENVLAEINQRTASASCDRRTNYLIEKLCFAADLKNLLIITRRFIPYAVFLARNRYSSHVMQAILSRMCYILKFDDFGDIPSSEVQDCMEEFCRPIMKEISWLILEQSASHVVRSMLSLLTGIPIIAERKGKNSKHQHSIALSEPLDALMEPGLFYIGKKFSFSVPTNFHDIILSSAESLVALSTKELERLIADFSSSAVLGFLIRILANPQLLYTSSGPALAQRLYSGALGWRDCPALGAALTPAMVPETVQHVFYAMAGDRAGSYFLEALIECSSVDFLLAVVTGSITGKCREYVEDGSGNFVLQAILRRISCELPRAAHTAQVAKRLRDLSIAVLTELVESDYFTHLVNFKGGVVLWLLAVTQGLAESSYSETVGQKVLDAWIASALSEPEEGKESPVKAALEALPALPSNATEAELATYKQQQLSLVFSSKLIGTSKAEKEAAAAAAAAAAGAKPVNPKFAKGKPAAVSADPRDTTQLLVARLIGGLIKSKSTAVSLLTVRAFAHLTPESLKYVATSGAVSRAVLDVFFEVTAQTTEFKLMGINLASIGVELAQHYVGQHIVRQSFESADLRGKEKWAMTLAAGTDVLSRNKEGMASLRLVNTELYQRDATEWRSTIKRKLKAESMLKELDAPATSTVPKAKDNANNKAAANAAQDKQKAKSEKESAAMQSKKRSAKEAGGDEAEGSGDEGEEGQGEGMNKSGRKRKRKRPTKAGAGASA